MRTSLIVSSALLALGPVAAFGQQPATPALQAQSTQPIQLDRIVGVVGDVLITQSNLQERVVAKRAEGVRFPTDSSGFHTFVLTVLNEIVDEELLLQKAKELKVEVPDADVTSTIDKNYKDVRKRFTTESEFKNELSKAGYGTPEEYKRFLGDGIRRNESITRTIRKLKEDGKVSSANVTDADIAESFERTKASLPRREPSIAWRQIIIAPRASLANKEIARQKAETLLAALKAGADFEQTAKHESADSSSRVNGGDLGWNRRGKMLAEFDRWMFALPVGQLSPVIETAYGYHIIRVDRAQPAEVKARHILISPKVDTLDVARAKLEADSVLADLKGGASFDTLAKKHHDFKSEEQTTILQPIPRAQLPTSYQQGFADTKARDVVEFPIQGNAVAPVKFVVAQIVTVEEGGDLTLAEVKERFRSRLAEEGGIKRLMESLRKGTYVSIREDALTMGPPPPQAP